MAAKPAVRALLFDLGRVVIDIDPGRVFQYWSDRSGCPAQDLASRHVVDDAYRANERGEIAMQPYLQGLQKRLGLEGLSQEQLLEGWNRTFVGVVAEVDQRIAGLKGRLPLHALSNTNEAHVQYMRTSMAGVLARFDAVHMSPELGARKPEAQAFERVIQKIGCAPDQILFFDDSLENIEGARKVGLQTVWVRGVADTLAGLNVLD